MYYNRLIQALSYNRYLCSRCWMNCRCSADAWWLRGCAARQSEIFLHYGLRFGLCSLLRAILQYTSRFWSINTPLLLPASDSLVFHSLPSLVTTWVSPWNRQIIVHGLQRNSFCDTSVVQVCACLFGIPRVTRLLKLRLLPVSSLTNYYLYAAAASTS